MINQYCLKKKTLNVNKQQKAKWLKISTPTQILQRLPIAVAQNKVCNTSI